MHKRNQFAEHRVRFELEFVQATQQHLADGSKLPGPRECHKSTFEKRVHSNLKAWQNYYFNTGWRVLIPKLIRVQLSEYYGDKFYPVRTHAISTEDLEVALEIMQQAGMIEVRNEIITVLQ